MFTATAVTLLRRRRTSFAEGNIIYTAGVTSFCVRTYLTMLVLRPNDVCGKPQNDVVSLRTQTQKTLLSIDKRVF